MSDVIPVKKRDPRDNIPDEYKYKKGQSGNPKGASLIDPVVRMMRKEAKKRAMELLAQHEHELTEALPEIRPALVKRAAKGELGHIQEIHKIVGAYKKSEGPATAIQVNINEDRERFA